MTGPTCLTGHEWTERRGSDDRCAHIYTSPYCTSPLATCVNHVHHMHIYFPKIPPFLQILPPLLHQCGTDENHARPSPTSTPTLGRKSCLCHPSQWLTSRIHPYVYLHQHTPYKHHIPFSDLFYKIKHHTIDTPTSLPTLLTLSDDQHTRLSTYRRAHAANACYTVFEGSDLEDWRGKTS